MCLGKIEKPGTFGCLDFIAGCGRGVFFRRCDNLHRKLFYSRTGIAVKDIDPQGCVSWQAATEVVKSDPTLADVFYAGKLWAIPWNA